MNYTPGPWRWELNRKHHGVSICGGKRPFDLTVMDFVRYGMSRAAPRFLEPLDDSSMMLLHRCERYAATVPGREHHADWFQTIDHPDAHLIAAAPDLLEALKTLLDSGCQCPVQEPGKHWASCEKARAAVAKAEGKAKP